MHRPPHRNRLLAIAACVVILFTAVQPAASRTFGLVVGVNDYVHLSKLNGAVNDARDIADAMKTAGVDHVFMLLDGEASRENILNTWASIVGLASPGDTIIFSYAGHGGQELERVTGSEADGLDEVFLLPEFNNEADGTAERIVDDELNRLFASAAHLRIIFVADSCHSGTMTRRFDTRAGEVRTRMARYDPIVDDHLPQAEPADAELDLDRMNHVVFFAAVQDHEVAMEFPIDGVSRGALSWSFARALRGHADQDGDGVVATRELERYLTESVRTLSEGRQFPQMLPDGEPAEVALRVGRGAVETPDASAGPLRLHIITTGDVEPLVAELTDAALAPRDTADLIWDVDAGEIVASSGDIVARPGPQATVAVIQPLIDKWLLLKSLATFAESRPLSLRIDAGHSVHHAGKKLNIVLSGHEHANLTLFNLAVDGTVQFLVPWPSDPNPAYHGPIDPDGTFKFNLKVRPPYGADHLVALTSPEEMESLHADLLKLDGKKAAGELRRIIADHLKQATYQLGTVGLFTAPRPADE